MAIRKRVFTLETLILASKRKVASLVDLVCAVDLMDFMSGEDNCLHQLPRAMEQIVPVLHKQFPWLADVPDLDHIANQRQLFAFMNEQIERFGASFEVTAMDPGTYDNWDPLHAEQEMAELDAKQQAEANKASQQHGGMVDIDDEINKFFGNGPKDMSGLFGDYGPDAGPHF